jgi:large subunit ribosomal protein L25
MLLVDVAGAAKQYLIKEVQYDHLQQTPLHLDLVRISMHEKVTVTVGIELRGVPRGLNEGGVLDQVLGEIEVECLPTDIPQTLHPLVINLGLNETLFVRDLDLPAGVTVLNGPDERVATVRPKLEAPAEGEAVPAAEGEPALPEVIGRGKKEEEAPGEE